jgi:hypothetical protein
MHLRPGAKLSCDVAAHREPACAYEETKPSLLRSPASSS